MAFNRDPNFRQHFKQDGTGADLMPYLLQLDKNLNSTIAVDVINKLKEYLGMYNAKAITASQMRNIYNLVKDVAGTTELQLKRPKLAYISARQDKAPELIEFIDEVIKSVKTDDDVKNFKTFMEAVVAYHKYYNPK